jgi:hypothetical protein
MIIQRLRADMGTMEGRLVIETNPDDPNSMAELMGLQEELKLRPNVHTEGSMISTPPIEEIPPPAG